MISDSIESNATPEPETPKGRRRKAAKKAKPTKKPAATRKAPANTERTNKKAEVIALMKHAKGATLKVTSWQPHTVRGFVSILGSKGGQKIESSKGADGERTYKIARTVPPRRLSTGRYFRKGIGPNSPAQS